jgi:hypothetical protein
MQIRVVHTPNGQIEMFARRQKVGTVCSLQGRNIKLWLCSAMYWRLSWRHTDAWRAWRFKQDVSCSTMSTANGGLV